MVLSLSMTEAAVQTISLRLEHADGQLVSYFADLQLFPVDMRQPRWAPSTVMADTGRETRELDSNDLPLKQPQTRGPISSADADCITLHTQTHAFINLIPNRDVIGQWMSLLLPQDLQRGAALTLAEVGVRRADFSLNTVLHGCGQLCRHWLLVDVWDQQQLPAEEYIDAANDASRGGNSDTLERRQSAEDMKATRIKAANLAKIWDLTITVVQSASVLAAKALRESNTLPLAAYWRDIDRSGSAATGKRTIDFVYLDARHDYRSVVEDICSWFPLVTPGGILAGHDYIRSRYLHNTLFTVRQAVDKFVFDLSLQLHNTQEAEENFPTWFVHRPRTLSTGQHDAFRRFCSVLE